MKNIGHRGAMGYAPENTLLSFKEAIFRGADTVECDVHVCKTGEAVVIHDKKVNRTTNGTGVVAEMTLAELQQLDAGDGEKIPTLIELLDLLDTKTKINIELKGKGSASPVNEIIERYVSEKGWIYDDILVSSFKEKELRALRAVNAQVKLGVLLLGFSNRYVSLAKEINAFSIHPNKAFVTKEFVDTAQSHGYKVFVWTLRNEVDIARLRPMGVDAVITNFPDTVRLP